MPCGGDESCQSEDCLHLSVYCPAGVTAVPVFFWIYGGAFNEGMNWGPLPGADRSGLYDGANLAATGGICVVAANYRLGVLGFLVLDDDGKGNQAIQDQRAAMQWTRDNIAAFGGDPDSITIGGQSAGAMSTAVHLVSPHSAGLFHRAILQSAVAAFQYQRASVQKLAFGHKFASLTGCGSLSNTTCLRALTPRQAINFGEKASGDVVSSIVDRILEGGRVEDAFAMQWSPVVDGDELSDQPLKLMAKGTWNQVPLLIGTVQDEGATFIYAGVTTWLPEALHPLIMDAIFFSDGPKVVDFYKPVAAAWRDARDSLSYVLTDYWFKCSSARMAALADAQGQPAYVYRFNHSNMSLGKVLETYHLPKVCERRTCHASEIPFVFSNYANYSSIVRPDEKAMSAALSEYWTSFVRSGDPNGGGAAVAWPRYNASERLNLRVAAAGMEVESSESGQKGALPTLGVCAFWDSVGYDH